MNNKDNTLHVSILKNVEDIAQISSAWSDLVWHPNADPDFYLNVIKSFKENVRPYILLIRLNNKVSTLLIGRLEKTTLHFKIGYKNIMQPHATALTFIYGGLLGEASEIEITLIMNKLMEILRHGEADVIFFNHLRKNSLIYKLANNKTPSLLRNHTTSTSIHWIMNLPQNSDDLYRNMSSNKRQQLRKYLKHLEKEYKNVELKCFMNESEVEVLCRDVEEVANKTYQRGIGVGFINNEETVKLVQLSARKGWLRAYVLYIDNIPCAFMLGKVLKDSFYGDYTGYDPELSRLELGQILFMKVFDALCVSNIRIFDFGFGDAFYKQRYANCNWEEESVYIFAPSLKGFILNAQKTSVEIIDAVARKILRNRNSFNLIKKYWRMKAVPKISEVEKEENKIQAYVQRQPTEQVQDEEKIIKSGEEERKESTLLPIIQHVEKNTYIVDILVQTGLCRSKNEARRIIQQGACWIENDRVDSITELINMQHFTDKSEIRIRKGKNNYAILKAKE